jgi:hypothetical protein
MSASTKPRALSNKKLDLLIQKLWGIHANGVQVDIMDIPKIFRHAREAFVVAGCPRGEEAATAAMLPTITAMIAEYRKN